MADNIVKAEYLKAIDEDTNTEVLTQFVPPEPLGTDRGGITQEEYEKLLNSASADDVSKLKEATVKKIDKPLTTDDGKIPRAKNGGVEWVDVGQPTDEQTNSAVMNWLDEHPEVTTTVQDGSLEEVKFTESLKMKTIKDCITPQMFGAKGDGVTDDTQSIQKAIEFCGNNKNVLYIPSGVYIISNTLVLSKSIAIVGSSVHRDILSGYNKYIGISVLKFVAESNDTLIETTKEAYDVSLNSLVVVADTYKVKETGNISMGETSQKYFDYIKSDYDLNAMNVEKSVRCNIDNCTFSGFSGVGIITGQHKYITGCSFVHCNVAIQCTNYDNIIHYCFFRLCSICIYSNVANTLFLSDSWFDLIEQIAIKYDAPCFMLVDNCEFDMIDYCAIYSKQLYSSSIQGRFSRCGMCYGGFEPEDVPLSDEYKSCCIYSKSVATKNHICAHTQRREIKSGYGVAPSAFFGGNSYNNSNLILDVDENHISRKNIFQDTNLVLSGKQYKVRHTLRYNSVGCVSKGNEDPNGYYYSIDIGDIYISTSGKIYISVKKNSNADWVLIGSKSV